jgi:MFS family permease
MRLALRPWWFQFPAALREVALLRLLGSFGAGGVLYLTPLVFHQASFRAVDVGGGLAASALAGTLGRFLCGLLLDRGLACTWPVMGAAALALLGDISLWQAATMAPFLRGQVLLGLAMGFYWPAIELVVPLCSGAAGSSRAFALVRSADAVGIAGGAFLGAALAALGRLRGIYVVDALCLIGMMLFLLIRPLPRSPRRRRDGAGEQGGVQERDWRWLPDLLPLLGVSVVATAMPSLMQSALPLDLVRGSLARPPLPDQVGALLLGTQLGLLVLLQWPVGRALARRPVATGLRLSLLCFLAGCGLLAGSALWRWGTVLVLLAQLPIAVGQASFLPVATEAVVELTPPRHQGLAMALFSQCFAVSAFGAPLLAGSLLDGQGHGLGIWLLMGATCGLGLPLVRIIDREQQRQLLHSLTQREGEESRQRVLYRVPSSDAEP